MDEQRPLAHTGPMAIQSRSDGSSHLLNRLARSVEIERTCVPERAAKLMVPPDTEPLDRFERALAFAVQEASDRMEATGRTGREHG